MPASPRAPRAVVLDAGPLIALFVRNDQDHQDAVRGFEWLADAGTSLVTPVAVVFEVYKWLLYHAGYGVAREGLDIMRQALVIQHPGPAEFDEAATLSAGISGWMGTLEDAIVVSTALRQRMPVWTLNYRDFSAFPRLRFWTPGQSSRPR